MFPKKEVDSLYPIGFVYLDLQAGFTLNYEGTIQLKNDGSFKINKIDENYSSKIRLEPYKTSNVYIIPNDKLKEIGLPEIPDWLKIYLPSNDQSIETLKDYGFQFNHLGACEKALTYLEKAYKMNPHYDGLEFELAYAYNHLGQYEKAILVLEKAINNNSKNYLFYRELGHSYVFQNKNNLAEKTILEGIKMTESDFEKSELAFKMSQRYFLIKNRKKFDEWTTITKQYTEPNSQHVLQIDLMNSKWEVRRE
ncbi:MAG TPA: tetratricopeptide repeat protein [Flavobacterium sp.]|uniref:tetratricopeptide repeat protein n=1 Tax=unclassified Flavobacterium TaxID=196869 RepID=UPI0025BCF0D7|nr:MULTISPECIES: tetratricopeptide repeat protein [unclassified Flavobacterium]HRE77168.1 tetratricopeptide repeat protein [Flavobacterium sp.]